VDFGADLAMPRFPARPALFFLFKIISWKARSVNDAPRGCNRD
jgi:hypothetical protein